MSRSRVRRDNDMTMRRRIQENEEEIIRVPAFDNSDLIDKFKQTLIGRIVGKALGVFDKADVDGSRVRVLVNGDLPLKFECKVGFENGDVVKVTIQYEDLYRHCYSCKRISHEEGTCPEINDNQRERNRLARIELKEKEDMAMKEAFSQPQRRSPRAYTDISNRDNRGIEMRSAYQESSDVRRGDRKEDERYHDLRKQLKERRDAHSKNVWNRLETGNHSELPRNRERYHPYQNSSGALSKERTRDSASSSEWRPKRATENRYENQSKKYGDHGYTSSRSRMSFDSQRTISVNPRRHGFMDSGRGRNSRSPPSGVMEWRPVNRGRDSDKPRGLLKKDSTLENSKKTPRVNAPEESASRRSNSEDHGPERVNQTTQNREIVSEERGQEDELIKNTGNAQQSSDNAQGIMMGKDSNKGQETEKMREENELDENIEEYADLVMTDEMINEDDLLKDCAEMEKEALAEMEDGRIEAISQLSPERPSNKTTEVEANAPTEKLAKQGIKKSQTQETIAKNQKSMRAKQSSTLGRKRGARSPDLKGASASRKQA
ncbi:LOW QUALITY PROTEIN: hypothetical protein HID58_043095, partial [Brassica napus]